MKKIITLIMSLVIMMTVTGANIHADDTTTITQEGGSQDVDVLTAESVTTKIANNEDVFKVTIDWQTIGATYERSDKYTWDTETLNYVLKDENKGVVSTSDATATITITNYSNTDIDYDISFSSKTVSGKNIASETKASDSAFERNGVIASADETGTVQETVTNTTKQATYKGVISYLTTNYRPEDENNTQMGTYSISISKAMTLSDYSLYLRVGKTATLTSNKTVTWSSSDTGVATIDNTGKVTAIAAGTVTITATDAYNRSKTCSVTVRPATYYLTASQDDFDLLLASDTVDFTYNGITYTAYNGFIRETQYATWNQAQEFVKELNADTANGATNSTKILPNGVTDESAGSWILLSSGGMAYSWATASGANGSTHKFSNFSTVFGGPYILWSSNIDNSENGIYFHCDYGFWGSYVYTTNSIFYGYIVIWQPAN